MFRSSSHFFNRENFLPEAIESVLHQSYETWELLLIDDGSTDQSNAIATEFVKQHPAKIQLLTHAGHRNEGQVPHGI